MFEEYLKTVELNRPIFPRWRDGQLHFNVLHEILPEIANELRSTPLDPFHIDARLPDFLKHVEMRLNELNPKDYLNEIPTI